MSDSEEENLCFYGKALEPYDEESFPRKKPISVEEQIATDDHGRRRFHGAFTGGFSAGFFNTVGSLEGWRPSEFKSSRSEKAEKKMWKPEDYMDEEDTGEFGIAPQTVKATNDYSTSKKRKKQVFSDGPIPGEPVLHTLISSGNETVGYLLMRNMGSSKHRVEQEEGPKTYGCEMPKTYEIKRNTEDDVTLIPDVYLDYLKDPKINTFGLGHVGLIKTDTSIYKPTQLVVHDKNKKFSIAGQAFGVGAFEDDDEDIYVKEDMAKYDFELTAEAKSKKKKEVAKTDSIFDLFQQSNVKLLQPEKFPPPVIPQSFSGKHNIKKSRFEPLPEREKPKPRKEINAAIRAKYLGEDAQIPPNAPSGSQATQTPDIPGKDFVKMEPESNSEIHGFASGLLFGKFVAASQKENLHDILETVERSETEHGTQEMRDAAKLNMFGPLTRVVADWIPCSLLCKRFNVPEPTSDFAKKDTKKKNPLIFEYQKNMTSEPILKPGLSKTKPDEIQEQTESAAVEETPVNEEVQDLERAGNAKPKSPPPPESTVKEEEEEEVRHSVDPTEKIDVSKNIDLFKAVFLSSSESESEDEKEKEEETQSRNDLIKATILSDHLIPKIKTKQGILSNIGHTFNPLFKKPDAPSEINKDEGANGTNEGESEDEKSKSENVVDKPEDTNLYGPKLPERIQPVQKNSFVLPKAVRSKEKWVEKDALDRKKPKHKKKHKKEKHRKREHKSSERRK